MSVTREQIKEAISQGVSTTWQWNDLDNEGAGECEVDTFDVELATDAVMNLLNESTIPNKEN